MTTASLRPLRERSRLPVLAVAALWLAASLAPVAARAEGDAEAGSRPVFMARSAQAAPIDLQAFRGQVVLLYFWSTDCPVCLQNLPELRRNLRGWQGKPFTVIAVSQDRRLADLQSYETILDRLVPPTPQMKIVWRGAPGHRDSFGDLPMNTPTSVIVDRSGAVAKQVRGAWTPALWDDIAELLLN
jgi:thiol-disulfide isomerase/thioredoxin